MNTKVTNFQPVKFSQTLTTDTNAYATGDVLVATVAVPIVSDFSGPKVLRLRIDQLGLIDAAIQNGALDIVILDANVSMGTVNSAVAITDANAVNVVKVLNVSASNYNTLKAADNSVANIDLAAPIYVTSTDGSFYVSLISRDAKTYAATSLTFRGIVTVMNQDS
jgi:PKD repeat protein